MDPDTSKTLEELDGEHWAAPENPTGLIESVHRLRRVPIGELTNGDLRLLLRQQHGTEWLVPRAIERLALEPLAGDLYPGDLLGAVLDASADYWNSHPTELMQLWAIRQTLESLCRDATKAIDDERWPAFG